MFVPNVISVCSLVYGLETSIGSPMLSPSG
jgi:hypothetical protein